MEPGRRLVSRRELMAGAAGLAVAGVAVAACARPPARTSAGGPRVVALGFVKDTDAAIALGVVPVAVPSPTGRPELPPWTAAALGGRQVHFIPVGTQVSLEQVAAFTPELILATGFYSVDRYRDQLAEIAPVVLPQSGPNTDPWQVTTRRVGEALGREAEAEQRIDELERRLEQVRVRYPELVGRTFTFSSSAAPGTVFTKNAASDVIALTLGAVGLRLAPQVSALPPAATAGFAEIGDERLDVLDADLVMLLVTDEARRRQLENLPTFRELPAVRRGAYVALDQTDGHALAFPSVLATGYVIDAILPRLADALR